jgi:DNA helicase-2/ATP-dependent DNA helicase PcrA
VGGTRFYSRREIKDCLAYLRVLANPKDMVSFLRLQKLGKTRLNKFFDLADSFKKNNQSFPSTLELLDRIFEVTAYLDLFDPKDEEDLMRLENIKELRSVAAEFPDLPQFLENVALVEQEHLPDHPLKQGKRQDAITLMTMHAAKGLEFPVVFMIGMEEGLFPHSRSMLEKEELEEERRLCYVGITRAMDRVFLTFARRRLYFGIYGSNLVSRFLKEIPEKLLDVNFSARDDNNISEFSF